MKTKLLRLNIDYKTPEYGVPEIIDREGYRISKVFIDGNNVPENQLVRIGPRIIRFGFPLKPDIEVEATIDEIQDKNSQRV